MEETSASTAERPAMPRFTADRLVIEPVVERPLGRLGCITRRGSDVLVAIAVTNEGGEAGIFTAHLVLDGEVMGWRDVRLAPGETKQVRFLLGNIPWGTHWVSLAGFTGTFTSSMRVNWPAVAAVGCVALCAAAIATRQVCRTYSHR